MNKEYEKRSRKWNLTFNNPVDHGYTHDRIKEILKSFKTEYFCMCDEIGEEKTPHTHLFIYNRNAISFSLLFSRFQGSHIEVAKGTCLENREYIRKEGKHENSAKKSTNIPATFEESGVLPDERSPTKKVSDETFEMLKDGASDLDILERFPACYTKIDDLNRTRQVILADQFKHCRDLDIQYWEGDSCETTKIIMDTYGYSNVFRVTNYDKNPFDGYCGEDVLLFADFYSSLPITDMKKYLQGYPLKLPCRYHDSVACYTRVFIVSSIPFSSQYPEEKKNCFENWKDFMKYIPKDKQIKC